MEDIRVHLESVTRRYRELDEKFAEKGGLASFFGRYGRIGELLDQISTSELDLLVNEIQRAKETLNHLQEAVTEIRVFKEVVASAKSRVASASLKS